MNILVLASEYPYEKDTNADRTKVVGYFAREWVKQGHKVVVIVDSSSFPSLYYAMGDLIKGIVTRIYDISRTPNRLWTKRFSYDDFGVQVENLPIIKMIPHGKFSEKNIEKQFEEIISILNAKEFVPDIVTGHWVNPQLMLIPKLAKKYNAKSAFVFHADYEEENCRKFEVQKYLDQIDRIGFRSKSAIDVAKNYLKFKKEPFVAASGIPDKFVELMDLNKERVFGSNIRFISAGRLVEYKKIDVALKAAEDAMKGKNFEFIVAGDGPLKKKLQEYIDASESKQCFHLLGQIGRDELQKKMNESDVFVLISKHETFGLVYLEAMLQGCIVIASRFGGVDGIIRDGENGFLCEEGNGEELKEIIRKIQQMSNVEKQRISQKAIQTACLYTEQQVSERYLNNVLENM